MTVALRPRPARAEARPWSFPSFERFVLANGITVLACHLPDRPVIKVRILLSGGPPYEPLDRPGLALIAGGTVSEGTETRTADEFALAVESLGARFRVQPDWNALVGNLSAPVSRLRPALSLAVEALTTPAFGDDDVARIARNVIGGLSTLRQVPNGRAQHALAASTFTTTSRMARPKEGTIESLQMVTSAAARRFWTETVTPSACTLVVVGDLRDAALDTVLDETFGQWVGAGGPGVPVWPVDSPTSAPGVRVADFPGSVQTVLSVGVAWPRVPVEDRAALRVAAHYLGGFFGSRLMTVLREEKAIAYGAGAGVEHRGTVGVLTAGGSVQTDATADAVTVVLEEIRAVAADDIRADVFARSVENLVGTGPVGYKSGGAVATALSQLVLEGLPDDYYDRVRQEMAETSAECAAAVFDRYVATDRLQVVAAGDASRIAEPLERLAFAPVTVEPRL